MVTMVAGRELLRFRIGEAKGICPRHSSSRTTQRCPFKILLLSRRWIDIVRLRLASLKVEQPLGLEKSTNRREIA